MIVVSNYLSIDLFLLCVMAVCQLIIFVTMRQEPRRSNSVVREVLKDLIHNQNNIPSTNRKNSSLEVIKLGDAVSFLQRKIERQYSQIQVLSQQLSKEISVKEELAVLLGEEKEKLNKTNQHLINANKQNAQLKKKIMKLQKQQGQGDTFKAQYEIRLNKYRDIVRKKDELLTKNQQKLEQLLKADRQAIQKEQELKSMKETLVKLRAKDENSFKQIQSLKKKHADIILQLEQKEQQIMNCKEQLMFASERISRLQDQNKELNEQNTRRELESASMIQRLSLKLRDQQYQMAELSKRRSVNLENTQWDLQVYKNELRRVIGNCIKDNNLRRKIQRDMLQILSVVECSFRSTLQKVISSLQV